MNKTKIEWTDYTWNPVPGYPGYFVTGSGLIRGPRKMLHPMEAKSGHLYVIAYLDRDKPYRERRGAKLFVHKAVLLTFRGPPPPGCESRHLDGNPKNNDFTNLEWGTRIEQRADARRHGTLPTGERSGTSKLTKAQVIEIKKRRSTETLRSLGNEFGVSHTCIRRAANGMNWGCLNE
jgi:hypothetical protein